MEKSDKFHEMVITTYTEEGGVILHAFVGVDIMKRVALCMGRHVALVERSEVASELSRLLEVRVWSLMQEHNLVEVMGLLKSSYEEVGYGELKFKFMLNQAHCEERHLERRGSTSRVLYVKNFLVAFIAQLVTSLSDTILVEEDPEKAIHNPPHLLIHVRKYEGLGINNVLLGSLLPYLEAVHSYPGPAIEFIKSTPYVKGEYSIEWLVVGF
ncbi:hypothetical protein GOP47_0019375 [Adiantum capillus-veneris]|uniref:FCP1 homology domain-containing protein n=1 Tax=Adiantum capillus-veneris TaxID=13818 RepID=A0A9D4UBF5_ADICA|nr:hypothetical protein GOP47_0019375 [Adiantum capillus-veneris]